MSKKTRTVFVCQECGFESPKWQGQCICGQWNTLIEEKVVEHKEDDKRRRGNAGKTIKSSRLSDVSSSNEMRINTGIGELNRVLGGGLVKGSLILISGEPGIGKSTIIIQAAAEIAKRYGKVLYVTGEESKEQIKLRADRVCNGISDNLFVLVETNMENIIQVQKELEPIFLIIDSIQTMYTDDLESSPGSVSQIRACGNELMKIGKEQDIPIFIVAHVTKTGDLAGPKIIEHMVDCVLNFTGERNHDLRILRAYKNRFGTTSEIGAFEMTEEGLTEIQNLSKSFLEGMEDGAEGSMATAIYEGTRPLLLEVQSLTSPTNIGFARRTALGVELSRLNMILAVLERKAGLTLINQDVYVNIVGGLKPDGTSIDLAVALAIYSTSKGLKCSSKVLAIGEIGLTGDLRSVQHADKIVKEASRMGFTTVIMPQKNAARLVDVSDGMRVVGVNSVREAIKTIQQPE